jgi:hypothetical protein
VSIQVHTPVALLPWKVSPVAIEEVVGWASAVVRLFDAGKNIFLLPAVHFMHFDHFTHYTAIIFIDSNNFS